MGLASFFFSSFAIQSKVENELHKIYYLIYFFIIFLAPHGAPLATPLYIIFSTPKKAFFSIFFTESGIINSFKPLQPWNADSPISLTESGILTDFKFTQFSKILLPILIILYLF